MTDDEKLRQLLTDAVSDVEPDDRITRIRAQVRSDSKVVPMSRSRSSYAAIGIIATAAVIGVIAYAASVSGNHATHAGPATDQVTPLPSPTASGPWHAAAIYYLGDGPRGTVLYREWSPRPPSTDPLEYAVRGLMTTPADPDYRTAWEAGWLTGATMRDGVIRVAVDGAPAARPADLTPRDASEAVQQVIYTVQAAVGSRDQVQFSRGGRPAASVLGVSTRHPLPQGAPLDVLSRMSISDPVEGAHLTRGRLVVTGVNNSFEATVVVRLERGGKVYRTKPGMASGYLEPRLFPWRVVIDTSSLPRGTYTLVASNDDPAGTGHPETDTRTVILD